jgi:hypothetical protein
MTDLEKVSSLPYLQRKLDEWWHGLTKIEKKTVKDTIKEVLT